MARPSLEERVTRAAEAALAEQGFVSPFDIVCRLGWLDVNNERYWRLGQIECLEHALQIGPAKRTTAMHLLRDWAQARGLRPTEVPYLARSRDRRELRFSAGGEAEAERAYRTHWIRPDMPEARKERLVRERSAAPDLVVVSPLGSWTCGRCGAEDGDLLLMQDDAPHCMACVRLDHLVFLPAGDAGLTRRAKAASELTAVVVRWSRTRKRYERQGLLVEADALQGALSAAGAPASGTPR